MAKLLILGSVAAACPPKKQGGTERVAFTQAKQLAEREFDILFVGGKGTQDNFTEELAQEGRNNTGILSHITFKEIGGGTQYGTAEQDMAFDLSLVEASRRMRLEAVNLAYVQQYLVDMKDEYTVILNNLRGASPLLQMAHHLGKPWVNVMHLNLFPELARFFKKYHAHIITIGKHQQKDFPDLTYGGTIGNPIPTAAFPFGDTPKGYALMVGTIGYHKNQKDAIRAAKLAGIPLVLAGKIRDQDYFDREIKPEVDGDIIQYVGELEFDDKVRLYKDASVFLFPVRWQEPFGLVMVEALACGTPVVAYPNGGPSEIVKDRKNGFLVRDVDEMALKIKEIEQIDRRFCRADVEERFDEAVIGEQYASVLKKIKS